MRVLITGKHIPSTCRAVSHALIIPGASGVLGSAVLTAFESAGHTVLGLAYSRATDKLKKVDLLNQRETEEVFTEFKPDCEYHRSLA